MGLMLRRVNQALTLAALVGIAISSYAIYVELKLEANPKYKAACDINDSMSCSKVLKSPYSKIDGIVAGENGKNKVEIVPGFGDTPVAVFGLTFYCLVVLLGQFDTKFSVSVLTLLTAVNNMLTIWMAYILFGVLKELCIVCMSSYVVNIFIAIIAYLKIIGVNQEAEEKALRAQKKKN